MMSGPLMQLTKVRLLEFFREPGIVFWVFGFPVVLALVLGVAFRNQTVGVVRVAPTPEAKAVFAAQLEEHERVVLVDSQTPERDLKVGRVDLILSLDGVAPRLQFDPSRQEGVLARFVTNEALGIEETGPPRKFDAVIENGSRYVDFLFPGVLGMNVMGSSLWGIGYSIVVARKRRLLKRLVATPMRHSHFLAAYALARFVFLGLEVGLLLVFGALAFGVTVQGSILSAGLVALAGATSFAGLSLLIASRVETVEAANGWLNLVMMPMWLCSGTFFSYERFPEFLHTPIKLLPLTALNDALRMIVNEGASVLATWPQMLVLAAWGAISFVIALKVFRWQ